MQITIKKITIMNAKIITGLIAILLFLTAGCIKDEPLKLEFNMSPANLDDGWLISSPGVEGIEGEELRMAYDRFFALFIVECELDIMVVRKCSRDYRKYKWKVSYTL